MGLVPFVSHTVFSRRTIPKSSFSVHLRLAALIPVDRGRRSLSPANGRLISTKHRIGGDTEANTTGKEIHSARFEAETNKPLFQGFVTVSFSSYPARIRTLTNRTKICCATVTLRGKANALLTGTCQPGTSATRCCSCRVDHLSHR